MLRSLHIENYALIDNLTFNLEKGLSIITGETGAGKSILLGALALVLGKRSDTSVLRDKNRKCIVEAEFDIKGYNLINYFKENDIDYDENTVIRREINSNGKSRSFINDTPINLDVLNDLSNLLIDIHSQHQNLSLNDLRFQISIIDSYSGTVGILDEYMHLFNSYRKTKDDYDNYLKETEKIKADLDFFSFQYKQLEEAGLKEEEQSELEAEIKQLSNAEEIKTNLETIINLLNNEENNVIQNVKLTGQLIRKIQEYIDNIGSLTERVETCFIELKDIANEIIQLNDKIGLDPERLNYVSQRLDLIYNLQQKHHVKSVSELISIKNDLALKLDVISGSEIKSDELLNKLNEIKLRLNTKAEELSKKRISCFVKMEETINSILKELGIPNASFKIERERFDNYTETGVDRIKFLFSANKNAPLQEISKIASGGELSRFMLAIKSLISHSTGLPTIIFDEIDSGVSGEIADKVGNIIKGLAAKMQVINITHLPQIASKANYHYLVYKEDNSTTTNTYIKLLSPKEREQEIARMLSGELLTDEALANARVLLNK